MEQIKTALADARSRLGLAQVNLKAVQEEALAVNARGVDVEKSILSIEGEIKALSALDVTLGE